jgi:hypothetical protein
MKYVAALVCAAAWSATAFQFPTASTGRATWLLRQRSQFRSWDDEREDRRREREEDFRSERGDRYGRSSRGPPRRDDRRDDYRGSSRGVQRTPLSELRQRTAPAPLLGAVMTTYESQTTSAEDMEHFFSVKSLQDIGANSLAVEVSSRSNACIVNNLLSCNCCLCCRAEVCMLLLSAAVAGAGCTWHHTTEQDSGCFVPVCARRAPLRYC